MTELTDDWRGYPDFVAEVDQWASERPRTQWLAVGACVLKRLWPTAVAAVSSGSMAPGLLLHGVHESVWAELGGVPERSTSWALALGLQSLAGAFEGQAPMSDFASDYLGGAREALPGRQQDGLSGVDMGVRQILNGMLNFVEKVVDLYGWGEHLFTQEMALTRADMSDAETGDLLAMRERSKEVGLQYLQQIVEQQRLVNPANAELLWSSWESFNNHLRQT